MTDPEDHHLPVFVVNEVDDPVTPPSYAVAISVARELLRSLRSGICRQGLNLANDRDPLGVLGVLAVR